MAGDRKDALKIISNMLAPEMAAAIQAAGEGASAGPPQFAGHIGELAMRNVFTEIWTREQMSPRDRSLATLSMLIALRANEEMRVHFPAAVRNGLTIAEIEELIYQATGYAGFPAANSARNVAIAALRDAGMIE
jgi:4-carboxymuconolactone decarboxylase